MRRKTVSGIAIRRIISVLCIAGGAGLMLFAPETPAGFLLLGLGISIEIIGLAMSRR